MRPGHANSRFNIFPDSFFLEFIVFAELVDSDKIIAALVIGFPDFTSQALCSAARHAGDILDIPVP
jgi:hypothetical protein